MAFLNKLVMVAQRTKNKQDPLQQYLHHELSKSVDVVNSSETTSNDEALDLVQFPNPMENHGDGVSNGPFLPIGHGRKLAILT